jgi:predicted outer membrane repeat protein
MVDKVKIIKGAVVLVFFSVLFSTTTVVGNVIYVDDSAIGANDGTSWENAFNYLQDALAALSDGEEIRVAQGIYTPDQGASQISGDREATFRLINNVTLKGGYAGYGVLDPDARDIDIYETILSGDLYGNDIDVNDLRDLWKAPGRTENSDHVVTCEGNSIIDGFTITGGNSSSNSIRVGGSGGGMYHKGSAQISNCTFTKNSAYVKGGGIYNSQGELTLINCTFSRNIAVYTGGGGLYNDRSDPNLINCTFIENVARNGNSGGGGIYNKYSSPILAGCVFIRNTAGEGGGIYNFNQNSGNPTLRNCLLVGNQAYRGGGIYDYKAAPILTNCTFAWNSSDDGNALYSRSDSERYTIWLFNCILWDGGNEISNNEQSIVNIFYSDIQGGWPGESNIDEDPLFADPIGPDNIPGTEDDDLRLTPLSPCIDSSSTQYVSKPNEMDLDGNPRTVGGSVDMGVYEYQKRIYIYVDDDAPGDPGPGDILVSDPLENGSESHPMDSIQEGIDMAKDGYTVLVQGGIYSEPIDFKSKAITVTSGADIAVLETPGDYAVSFLSGEGRDSILKNFVIRNSLAGVFIPGSSPTIRNLTLVNNEYGITAYTWAEPDISNCIFWNNSEADLFQCEARHSCIEDGNPGEGNIRVNPLFVDVDNGDYHLLSEGWRWNGTEIGTYDDFTSFCIDAGDPASPLGDELMSAPRDPTNIYGINLGINMGAYGGTCQASMPPLNWFPEYETDPPEPNPAQWAYNGEPKEIRGEGDGVLNYWVQMTAAEATDASGPVEYLFEQIFDPYYSSGWQSSRTYMVQVGMRGGRNRYRVKARDMFGNETEWSEELSVDW